MRSCGNQKDRRSRIIKKLQETSFSVEMSEEQENVATEMSRKSSSYLALFMGNTVFRHQDINNWRNQIIMRKSSYHGKTTQKNLLTVLSVLN